MYISTEDFASMIEDGSIAGKTIYTLEEGDMHEIIYEFLDVTDTRLYYLLTNHNNYEGSSRTEPLIQHMTTYYISDFLEELRNDGTEYVYISDGEREPDWEV